MLSLEWLALEDAGKILNSCRNRLYVGEGLYRYLPRDSTTQIAFGALCHAHRINEDKMRSYLIEHPYDTY